MTTKNHYRKKAEDLKILASEACAREAKAELIALAHAWGALAGAFASEEASSGRSPRQKSKQEQEDTICAPKS